MIQIPQEIPNKQEYSQLKAVDRKIIAFAVLMNVSNQEAFMRYNPHHMRADGKGMNKAGVQASRQFWGWGKVKDYRAEYEKTIEDFFGGGKRNASEVSDAISDTRKDRALKSLLNQAMSMVEGGADLDADTLKTVTEIFRKLNILKEEQEQEIKPLRFLPSRCGECRYKAFVESSVLEGKAIDECQYCKALKFAKDTGFKYDPCKNLDLPEEVIKRLDEKNNISTLDILNGKIEN